VIEAEACGNEMHFCVRRSYGTTCISRRSSHLKDLALVDGPVGPIGAIERAGAAGGIHCPTFSAHPPICVKVSEVIGFRWQVCDGFECAFGCEDELVITLDPDACDKVRRRVVFDVSDKIKSPTGLFASCTWDMGQY
jgi:hypothetical protein